MLQEGGPGRSRGESERLLTTKAVAAGQPGSATYVNYSLAGSQTARQGTRADATSLASFPVRRARGHGRQPVSHTRLKQLSAKMRGPQGQALVGPAAVAAVLDKARKGRSRDGKGGAGKLSHRYLWTPLEDEVKAQHSDG